MIFSCRSFKIAEKAKSVCNKLIVGVSTDELVSYKHKKSVISFEERIEIVSSIKFVDQVIAQTSMDKFKAWEKIKI